MKITKKMLKKIILEAMEEEFGSDMAISKGGVDKEYAERTLQLAMENDSDVPFAEHHLTPEALEWMRNAAVGALGEEVNNDLQRIIEIADSYDESKAKAGRPLLPQPGDPNAPSPELMRAIVKKPKLVRFLLPARPLRDQIWLRVTDSESHIKIEFIDRGGRGYVRLRTYAAPDGTPVTFGLARKRKGIPQVSYAGGFGKGKRK